MRFDKLILALSTVSILATPAFAGFAIGDQVTMGGQPVFTIAGNAFGYSSNHRAWLAQDALDNALVRAGDRSPAAVTVGRDNGAIVVFLDGRKVATADENSAKIEGMSPAALADKWASGLKSFLSDSGRTQAYVAQLTGQNPINADVAIVERKLYAPPGTTLSVALATPLNSEAIKPGDQVCGTLTEDVAFGNYVIPLSTKAIGIVQEDSPGAYSVTFNTLVTSSGMQIPIQADLTAETLANVGPHLVATQGEPYGVRPRYMSEINTGCRIPAQVGIGTLGGGPGERLVFRRGTGLVIAAGTPMTVVFDKTAQVAVVLRNVHM